MSEDQKKQLQTQLWNIANELRGKMDADEFRDYILGFIFYKYLSEKIELYADELLQPDGITYRQVLGNAKEGEYIEELRKAALDKLGYFLAPNELFHYVAQNSATNDNLNEDLERIMNSIEQSTMGTDSEEDFEQLFSELDLNATKLGRTVSQRNELISKVIIHLDKIDFKLGDSQIDILGDAYEYLISQFASGAGKKAGEFYTPQEVSQILARIVASGKKELKTVYDPTCGSGSLLLRIGRYASVDRYFGQEMNNTTYNLARMNMILHDVHYADFDVRQEDTIEHPQHLEYKFEAIVANPPFSQHWTASPLHLSDERFSQYGVLAPRSYEEYAFIQHMLFQLEDSGTMATVMPLGVLFREGTEGKIRRYLIENKNYLDTVIVLGSNLFYGTPIPACILVFKKCRNSEKSVFFIDATYDLQKLPRQNKLRPEDIDLIIQTYESRKEIEKFSREVTIDELRANDYNLNITRYIDSFKRPRRVQTAEIKEQLESAKTVGKEIDNLLIDHCNRLGVDLPQSDNLELLNNFRLNLMDALFSGELHFKKSDGTSFFAWEKQPLHSAFKSYKGSGIAKDDVYEGGKYPCLLYGELYTTYQEVIDEVVSRTDQVGKSKSQAGDLLVPCSTTTTGIDLANVTFLNQSDVLIGGDVTILRPNEGINGVFYAYYLTHYKKYEIAKFAQGSTIIHLYYKHFKDIMIDVPEETEQLLVAQMLLLLDTKIMLIRGNIMKAINFKKSLLQKMFA